MKGKTFVASEPTAFRRYTKEFIALEDNEIAVITPDGHSLGVSRVQKVETQEVELSPDPYPHWTLKGIVDFQIHIWYLLLFSDHGREYLVKVDAYITTVQFLIM